ncbi:MAG: cupredoxin family copper-binding protein [Solirubrobacterales bacterium]
MRRGRTRSARVPSGSGRRRTATVALAAAAALVLAMATVSTASTEVPVSIVGRAYQPSELSVEAGQTVTWTNRALTPHTVTAAGGEFDSGHINPGETFKVTFTTPGTFAYSCTIHPTMHGEVTVLAPGSLPPGGLPGSLKLTLAKEHTAHGQLTLVRVQAPRPGAPVLLQARAQNGKWSTLRRAHLSPQGKATLSISASVHGKLRVVVRGAGGAPPISKMLTPRH